MFVGRIDASDSAGWFVRTAAKVDAVPVLGHLPGLLLCDTVWLGWVFHWFRIKESMDSLVTVGVHGLGYFGAFMGRKRIHTPGDPRPVQ